MASAGCQMSKAASPSEASSAHIPLVTSTSTWPRCAPGRASSTCSWRSIGPASSRRAAREFQDRDLARLPAPADRSGSLQDPHRADRQWHPVHNAGRRRIARSADQGSYGQWRTLLGARLRIRLRQERHRSPNHQTKASLDQRPSRADEPNYQRSDGQALLLRNPRPAARAPRQLRGSLQLRQTAQDPQGPHALRIHLQMLDKSAPALHIRLAPSTPGPNT